MYLTPYFQIKTTKKWEPWKKLVCRPMQWTIVATLNIYISYLHLYKKTSEHNTIPSTWIQTLRQHKKLIFFLSKITSFFISSPQQMVLLKNKLKNKIAIWICSTTSFRVPLKLWYLTGSVSQMAAVLPCYLRDLSTVLIQRVTKPLITYFIGTKLNHIEYWKSKSIPVYSKMTGSRIFKNSLS